MGDYNRKQFLTDLLPKGQKSKDSYDILKDEIFKKYANKNSPLGLKKSRAGLSQYTGVWGEKQKIHLLRRTMFGVDPSILASIGSMTMSQTVDALINNAPSNPAPPLNYYENLYADPTGVVVGTTWVNSTYGDGTVNAYRENSIKAWWIDNMVNQSLSIHEKMVLFWHNHFVTESNVVGDARLQYFYLDLVRTHALGNFKTFVKEITMNPMMLYYLNGHYNIKNSPDENYARELQELFTIGKGTNLWDEDDVKAAAKVLTGHRVNNPNTNYLFDPTKHETANKIFSAFYNNTVITGQSGAAGANELDDLLNMIFAQDQIVAKFICRKIYRFFLYYDIDSTIESTIIDGLAQTLINNSWNIKPVLLQLFKSDHFYDVLTMDCYIRTPIDYYVGLARTLGCQTPGTTPLEDYYRANYYWAYLAEQAGMELGSPPSVSGWPAFYQVPYFHEMWINSDTLPKRMRSSDMLFTNNGLYVSATYKIKCDVLVFVQTLSDPSDPVAVVDDCIKYLLALTLSQSLKDYYKTILLSGQTQNYYWTNAWNDYINNPGNTTYEGIVRTRLQLMLTELCIMAENHLC